MARRGRPRKSKPATTESTTENAAESGNVSKAAAVRIAIAEGKDTPALGTDYIRERFGLDISPQHFSAIKSSERAKSGEPKRRGPGRPRKVAVVAKTSASGGTRVALLTDLEAVKRLIAQHGAANVKRMIDLLG